MLENCPEFAENEIVDMLEAVRRPVLNVVVLRTAGTIEVPLGLKGTFVKPEPSPTCLP